jgi:hypothetical protein
VNYKGRGPAFLLVFCVSAVRVSRCGNFRVLIGSVILFSQEFSVEVAVKRSWNPRLWAGFALVLVGTISYPFFFIRFPTTRDFPWANLILLALAAFLLISGVSRAFGQPATYRSKVSGTILASLGALLIGFFLFLIFYLARQLPESRGAPAVGQIAPDFTLADENGSMVTLSTLLNSAFNTNDWPATSAASESGDARGKTAGALLIFYRGYW